MLMKKPLIIIFAILLSVLPLAACDCSEGSALAKTPQEEYARVYALAGNDAAFSFEEQATFSIETTGTFSGGNIDKSIQMNSVYKHDYSTQNRTSYARLKAVNSVSEQDGKIHPYYDEMETGFQYGDEDKRDIYQESFYDASADVWSKPISYGSGVYSDLFVEPLSNTSSDSLVRKCNILFAAEELENFRGEKSGGTYFVSADVKGDSIQKYADWLNDFLPLLRLKDNVGEWKFFDMTKSVSEYAGKVEIRSTPRALREVAVTFETVGGGGGNGHSLGNFEFTARVTFATGGVKVDRLSFYK